MISKQWTVKDFQKEAKGLKMTKLKTAKQAKEEEEFFTTNPIYGFSIHQDMALDLCRREHGMCPYGSIKDGSPNCNARVRGTVSTLYYDEREQCEPGKQTQAAAEAEYQRLRAEWEAKRTNPRLVTPSGVSETGRRGGREA